MGIFATQNLLQEVEQQKQQAFIQAVNEVYFGRTAGINRVFNAYCDWREPLVSDNRILTITPRIIYNKDMTTFRNLVCEQFGFKSFSYTVIPTKELNSFTLPSTILDLRSPKHIIVDRKNGYRFDGNISSIVCVYPDLIFSPEYTNEENFAIFLHEIGHNFQTAASFEIFGLESAYSIILAFMAPTTLFVLNDYTFRIANFVQNKLTDSKVISSLINVISVMIYVFTFVKSIAEALSKIVFLPINYILRFLKEAKNILWNLITGQFVSGYLGERFADGFAASYGFGEALASALSKLTDHRTIFSPDQTIDMTLSHFPLMSHIMEAMCIPGMLLLGLVDPHPQLGERWYSVIKDLRHDLNDPSLSPEAKKQLTKDIDSYEKAMKQYFDNSVKWENSRLISTVIQKWLYEKGGSAKFKLSELPFNKLGGFRGEQDKTLDNIEKGNFNFLI